MSTPKVWFTADLHLGHANIIKYANRPFKDGTEMDDTLISNWNSRVQESDAVYLIGDFCFARGNNGEIRETALRYLSRLNGHVHFIQGNHDSAAKKIAATFASFHPPYLEVIVEGQEITLCHYAMRVWNKSHYSNWHLYGHSHGTLPDNPHALAIDVGVDCHNYFPISFEQVKEIMARKLWKPIDHHGERQEGGGIGLSREEYAKLDRKRQYEQLKREFEPEFVLVGTQTGRFTNTHPNLAAGPKV